MVTVYYFVEYIRNKQFLFQPSEVTSLDKLALMLVVIHVLLQENLNKGGGVKVARKRIELLRGTVNNLILSSGRSDELLKKSQELDKLIVKSMKIKNYARNVLGNELRDEFEKVMEKLHYFESMYQSMRILDPIRKRILILSENEAFETDLKCYDYLGKEVACENCISIRAYEEGEAFFKMERDSDKISIVTAIPIALGNKRLVVELLRTTPACKPLESYGYNSRSTVFSVTEHMNQPAVKDKLTGLYNKCFARYRLPVDLLKSAVNNDPLTLVFMDLILSQCHKNPVSEVLWDRILRQFGKEIRKHIIGNGWASRYHKGKFIICIGKKDADDARIMAESIRKGTEQRRFITEKVGKNLCFGIWIHPVKTESEHGTFETIVDLAIKELNNNDLETVS